MDGKLSHPFSKSGFLCDLGQVIPPPIILMREMKVLYWAVQI